MEWGLTPEYLNENWTEELLLLMFKARTERIEDSYTRAAEPTKTTETGGMFGSIKIHKA